MAQALTQEFNWMAELDKTITNSLFSTFGLGFLLFADKDGGDVDTIHNVRKGIYATEREQQRYENRGEYDSHAVHSDAKFINTKRNLKAQKEACTLQDQYTGENLGKYENTHTDHIVSGHETHDDAGRVLAEVATTDVANIEENLAEVAAYTNLKKSDMSPEQFADALPTMIQGKQNRVAELENKLKTMTGNDAKARHERQKLTDKIRKEKEHLATLKKADPAKIKAAAKKARAAQDKMLNKAYYTSPKFLKNMGIASVKSGFKMGIQQVYGLLFREIWLGLKQELPRIYSKCKINFELQHFFGEIKQTIRNIWQRLQSKWKEMVAVFKESAIMGTITSIGTTLLNTFFTTGKFWVRVIRETFGSLVSAAKLLAFNPDKLPMGQLIKEVLKIIGTALAGFAGLAVQPILTQALQFPGGNYIANFLSAVLTGVLTVGVVFFFDYSAIMKKVMKLLDSMKSKYQKIMEQFQEINRQLDEQIAELARLEFNLDVDELTYFVDEIYLAGTPEQLSLCLKREIDRRGIQMEFDPTDVESTRNWLKAKLAGNKS